VVGLPAARAHRGSPVDCHTERVGETVRNGSFLRRLTRSSLPRRGRSGAPFLGIRRSATNTCSIRTAGVAVDLFQRTPSACDAWSRAGMRPGGRVGFRNPDDEDLKREREPPVSRDGRNLVVGSDVLHVRPVRSRADESRADE
jgi:hypothetical protein